MKTDKQAEIVSVNTRRTLLKAVGTLFSADALLTVFIALFAMALGRIGGVEVLGRYSIAFAVLAILETLADFGSDLRISRSTGAAPQESAALLRSLQAFKWRISLLLGLPLLIAALLSDPHTAMSLLFPLLWFLPRSYSASCMAVLRGLREVRPLAFIHATVTLAMNLCALAVFWFYPELIAIFSVYALFEFIKPVFLHIRLNRILRQRDYPVLRSPLPNLRAWLSNAAGEGLLPTLRTQFHLAGTNILSVFGSRSGFLLLETLSTAAALGYYSAAFRFISAMRLLPGAVFQILLPEFAARRNVQRNSGVRRALLLALFCGIAGAALLCGIADPLMRYTFGPEFAAAVPVLQVLVWRFPGLMLVHIFEAWLLARNRERSVNVVLLLELLLILGLGWYYVPDYGALAVAWIALGAQILSALLMAALLIFVARAEQRAPRNPTGEIRA